MREKNNSRLLMWVAMVSVFGIALQVTGCITHQAHPEDHESSDEIAVLHRTSGFAIWQDRPNIWQIDSKEVGYKAYTKFEMLPGQHRFDLVCEPAFSTIYTNWPTGGSVEVNMEAGHEYRTYCDITDDGVFYWIEDTETGTIVGGEKPLNR